MDAPELKTPVKGLLFLGTPHQGTPFTRFGIMAAKFLRPLEANPLTCSRRLPGKQFWPCAVQISDCLGLANGNSVFATPALEVWSILALAFQIRSQAYSGRRTGDLLVSYYQDTISPLGPGRMDKWSTACPSIGVFIIAACSDYRLQICKQLPHSIQIISIS